jgi:uncharacterized protein (TIGR00297 family)
MATLLYGSPEPPLIRCAAREKELSEFGNLPAALDMTMPAKDLFPLLSRGGPLGAAAAAVVFAAIGYLIRGVSLSGAVAGAVAAFLLLNFGGTGAFAALVAVFVITWLGTRAGFRRKLRLGIAESRRGRDAFQVVANLGVAAACAAISRVPHPNPILAWVGVFPNLALTSCMAALAEATADTISSECGEAWSERAYLITSLRAVPPGTDGAISLPGTLAGAVAAALIGVVASLTGVLSAAGAVVAAAAGFIGSLVDSVLGATAERRGMLGNNGVNFLSTLAAAVLAGVLLYATG